LNESDEGEESESLEMANVPKRGYESMIAKASNSQDTQWNTWKINIKHSGYKNLYTDGRKEF
jgi:hypothetical protein